MPQNTLALLKAADAGSERLDALVWDEVDPRPLEECGEGRWGKRDPEDAIAFDLPPCYTRSLDAARTLKPEGWKWGVRFAAGAWQAWTSNPGTSWITFNAEGATEEIAACRAFLMARSAADSGELIDVDRNEPASSQQGSQGTGIHGFGSPRCPKCHESTLNGVRWHCGDRDDCPRDDLPEHVMSIIKSVAGEHPSSPSSGACQDSEPTRADATARKEAESVDWHAKRVEVTAVMSAFAAIEVICDKAPEWSSFSGLIKGQMKTLAQATSEAVVTALKKDNAIVPDEPSIGRLVSMAMRADHAFCAPQQLVCGAAVGLSKAERNSRLAEMRKVYEEAVGAGFYSGHLEQEYVELLEEANARDLND